MGLGIVLLTILFIFCVCGVAIYLVGAPPEMKDEARKKIERDMPAGKAKDLMKDGLDKVPDADKQKSDAIASGINKVTGGDLRNPMGKRDV